MKNPIEKYEYRFFTPADFKEEQAYLEQRHRQGWAFVSVKRYKYHFKMAAKQEFTYERDYKEEDIFIDDYISMYEESGWELVYRTDENYYFRKANVVYPEEKEIFSTDYDRGQYFSKIHMSLMSDSFAVVLCSMFWVVATIIAGSFKFETFVDAFTAVVGIVLLILSISFLTLLFIKYQKLDEYKLTDSEIQEKEEEELEAKGEQKSIDIFAGETSNVGGFKPTKYSFEELLNTHIK